MRRHPIDRALLLYSLARPDTPPDALADAPLGTRNAALLDLCHESFGQRLVAWMDCPACGERLEFELDPEQFPPVPDNITNPIDIAGYCFHRPTSRHLARLTNLADAETAAQHLLRDCAESPDELPQDEYALAVLLDTVDTAMDDADPWATLSLSILCPACDHEDNAPFDIADYLWEEIESHARRLLDDIHILAQAYGWTEDEILSLSGERRAAYLARVRL